MSYIGSNPPRFSINLPRYCLTSIKTTGDKINGGIESFELSTEKTRQSEGSGDCVQMRRLARAFPVWVWMKTYVSMGI